MRWTSRSKTSIHSVSIMRFGTDIHPRGLDRLARVPPCQSRTGRSRVPCVVDRLVQQAVLQGLQAQWGPRFSEHSYGFRPGRSANQAVAQAQAYIAEGHGIVVDILLEKSSDRGHREVRDMRAELASVGRRDAGRRYRPARPGADGPGSGRGGR